MPAADPPYHCKTVTQFFNIPIFMTQIWLLYYAFWYFNETFKNLNVFEEFENLDAAWAVMLCRSINLLFYWRYLLTCIRCCVLILGTRTSTNFCTTFWTVGRVNGTWLWAVMWICVLLILELLSIFQISVCLFVCGFTVLAMK